jgi:hypothetical protein
MRTNVPRSRARTLEPNCGGPMRGGTQNPRVGGGYLSLRGTRRDLRGVWLKFRPIFPIKLPKSLFFRGFPGAQRESL